MSAVITLLARLGGLTDAFVAAIREAPGHLRRALAIRRYRRIALAVGLGYLIVYLAAIGDLAFSPEGKYGRLANAPSIQVVSDPGGQLFAEKASYLYEPIVSVYPIPQLAIFLSPGNLLLGLLLGSLLALNIGLAFHVASARASCRRQVAAPLLGALPSVFVGFACCVPSFILVLGTNFAAAFLPTFIAVRDYLMPLAFALMALMLIWSSHRMAPAQELRG